MNSGVAHRLSISLAMLALMSEFLLGGNVLEALGIPYVEENGPLIAKLSPATYLAAGAMSVRIVGRGTPSLLLWRLICQHQFLACYLAAILFCILYAACLTGAGGLVTLVETFLPAGMIGIALCNASSTEAARLSHMLRSLFLLNATFGLVEVATGAHVVPFFGMNSEHPADYRPIALYDHPLTGAAATMMGLLLCPDRLQAPWWRRIYQVWMFAALLAFGGRVAALATILGAVWLYTWPLIRKATSAQLAALHVVGSFVALLMGATFLAAIVYGGMAERLSEHFYWDPSAQSRIGQFHLLALLSTDQIIFGCPRQELIALVEPLRLGYGVDVIENFWLLMFATLGTLCFPVFVLGLFALLKWLWTRADHEGRIMVISFILVTSTSNSLGRKSTLLVMLVGSVLARLHAAKHDIYCPSAQMSIAPVAVCS